jgi:hypothetical protein
MAGWTVLFALLAAFGLIMSLEQLPQPTAAPIVTSFVFSALFVASLAARIIRKRA